jgi:hypothetical protein
MVINISLAAKRLGDFVRRQMRESKRRVNGLFESLLSQNLDGGQ